MVRACADLVSMAQTAKTVPTKPPRPPGGMAGEQAEAHFSELVRRVRSEGPRRVEVHGRDEVVVVAADEFRRLKGERTGEALIAAMQASPYRDIDIEPRRERLPVRDVSCDGMTPRYECPVGIAPPETGAEGRLLRRRATLTGCISSSIRWRKSVSASSLSPTRRSAANCTIGWRTRCARCSINASCAVSEDVIFKWRLLLEDGRKAGHTYQRPGPVHRRDGAAERPDGRFIARHKRI